MQCMALIHFGMYSDHRERIKHTYCGRGGCKKEIFMQQLGRIKSRCLLFMYINTIPLSITFSMCIGYSIFGEV